MRNARALGALGLLVALAVVSLGACSEEASDAPAGGGADGAGGTGGAGGGPVAEDCVNGTDDDEDGTIDCLDADCAAAANCVIGGNECAAQAPDCERDLEGSLKAICDAGTCAPAGPIEASGGLVRGNMTVNNRLDGVLPDLVKSFTVRVFHRLRPAGGEPLTCAALRALEVVDASQVNLVLRTTGPVSAAGDTIPAPAFGLPITLEGESFVVLTEFFSASRDPLTAEPRGELVGRGCAEGMVVPPGEWVDDGQHVFGVEVKPICDPANDTCPAPKTCMLGARICRDQRCDPACPSGTACRDVGEGASCLARCDPDNPVCRNLERCDAAVGEIPVCIPAG